jgi:hypothetical protein
MDEIILTYPNVVLYYHAPGHPCSGPALFKEIESGKYAYRLTVGQELEAIRYHGTNKDFFVRPKVLEIREDGLVITHFLQKEGDEPIFAPFRKSLPNAGEYEMRDMYIEPCGRLYEYNKLADVLAGTIATEDYFPNGKWNKDKGSGIWYMTGWRRTPVGKDDNLRNFVKVGQQAIFGEATT